MVIIFKMAGHFNPFLMPFLFPAYEIGQVKCGSCAVLLMYQYGASSVRCSSCCFVTEIGVSETFTAKIRRVCDLSIISQLIVFIIMIRTHS